MTLDRRGFPEIPLRERLRGLLAFRVAIVTVLLGGAVALDAHALSALSNPQNLTLLMLIVGTYLLTFMYAMGLRHVRNLQLLADLQIAGDIFITAILIAATGGLDSIFIFLFYVNIINAAVVAGRRTSLFAATTTAGCLIFLALVASQILHLPDLQAVRTPRSSGALIFEVGLNASAAFLVAILAGYLAERLGEVTGELERQQSNLVELRALNANILESLNSGLLTVDVRGRIIFFNRAAESITGYRSNEVYGRPLSEVFPHLADDFMQNPGDSRLESLYSRPGGGTVFLGFSTSPLRDARKEIVGRIVIFQDLSEVKKLEQQTKRAERLAAIGQLAAAIAHEIRNPLASISGSVEMLSAMANLAEDDAVLMNIVVREVDRLNNLITNFLEFSRPNPLNPVHADLIPLIQEVIDLFRNDKQNHAIDVDFRAQDADQDALPQASALVDREALRQILWNLLNNARDAMLQTHAAPRILVTLTQSPTHWHITVEDDGPGIDQAVAEHIFEPFFTTKETGTGLGLATLHRLVEQHHGHISLAPPQQLHGARFEVELPQLPPENLASDQPGDAPAVQPAQDEQ